MAIIANTMFEVKCSNSVCDEIANITGLFQAENANADRPAGFLCVRGENLDAEGYTGLTLPLPKGRGSVNANVRRVRRSAQ